MSQRQFALHISDMDSPEYNPVLRVERSATKRMNRGFDSVSVLMFVMDKVALTNLFFECLVFLLSELCHQCPKFVVILECYHY
jgi:hypothetical protein